MATRILAIVSQPVSAEDLRAAVGEEKAKDAEVMVIAPALMSRRRFLLADPDPGIEQAEEVQEETVQRLGEDGVDAVGDTGESDPLMAIQDALATYDADEIILFTHASGEQNWQEEGVVEEAEQRFRQPVSHLVIE